MLFLRAACPNPLESLKRRPSEVHKNDHDRKFSSIPAERERRSTPGAPPPGRIGGTMARRDRRVEPDGIRIGVRPSSPMAHRVANRRRRAGKRAGSRLFLRSLPFGERRPAAAGAPRALTGWIWGAGSAVSRNIIYRKEIFLEDRRGGACRTCARSGP